MRKDDELTMLEAMIFGMSGDDPSKAIENQERRGQQDVVRNRRLPKEANNHTVPNDILRERITMGMNWEERLKIEKENNIEWTKKQYEKMDIHIIDEDDDLFYNVELPEGWKIEATGHTMWNDLLDDKGRLRGSFFYKAAFYDRHAFINFKTRYSIEVKHAINFTDAEDYDEYRASDMYGVVIDGVNVIVFETERRSGAVNYMEHQIIERELYDELEKYMVDHYPNYKDIHAYWD